MSERLILFDGKKCIRCHSCEVGCQLENDAPPGIRLRRVRSHVKGRFPDGDERSISTACFHCNDPACVASCPAGALVRRQDGVVVHRRERCIGCGYCIQSCPFHVPQVSPAQHTMRKCSFCVQRIDHGKEPACVAKCPIGCADLLSRWESSGGAYTHMARRSVSTWCTPCRENRRITDCRIRYP